MGCRVFSGFVFLFFLMVTLIAFLNAPVWAEGKVEEILRLQMSAVQKQGSAVMAVAAQEFDAAIQRYQEAASLSRQVLQGYDTLKPEEKTIFAQTASMASSLILTAFMETAFLHRQQKRYEEAETALSEAMILAARSDEPVKKRQCLKENAELKWARKSFLSASLIFEKILFEQEPEVVADPRWRIPASGEVHVAPGFMDQVNNFNEALTSWGNYMQLASLYTHMSDPENALRIYQLPGFIRLRDWFSWQGRTNPGIGDNPAFAAMGWALKMFPPYYHIGKGLVFQKFERFKDSLGEFASASALVGSYSCLEVRYCLLNLEGYALQKMGKTDEAIGHFREAVTCSASLSSGIQEMSECYSRIYLIEALLEKNQLEEVSTLIPVAEGLARKVNEPRQLWDVLYLKGRALQKAGKLEEAFSALKESIENVEQFRAQLSLERLKRDYMATKTRVYESMVQVLLDLGRTHEALSYVERAKARAFIDLLGTLDKTKLLKPGDGGSLRQEFRQLEQKRRELDEWEEEIDRQLRGFPGAPSDKRGMTFLQSVSRQRAELQKTEDHLSEMAGAEFAALTTVRPTDISELKDFIDDKTVLVEFFRGPSNDGLYLFALDAQRLSEKNPLAVRLPIPDSQVRLKILTFRNSLESSGDEYPPDLHERARDLYKTLVGPFETLMAGKTRLIVVPHGNLNFLPFAALEDPEGKNLIDRCEIVYLPSAGTLRFCRAKNQNRHESLFAYAFGDNQTADLAPLPHTIKEVEAVGATFEADKRLVINSRSLSLEEFTAQVADREVIHLATHGVLNPLLPLESSIMLGLTAVPVKDVMALNLKASLVTLSACQTGLGKLYEGDEMVGLTRAFLYAGTPSVLSSLWPVSDESTALLMSEFSTHFKNGETKAHALKLAQIAVRAKFPSPYHWASFILTGDWK